MNSNKDRIQEIVDYYKMKPHPEGGFYAETYRSTQNFETPNGKRSASTAIMFLITKDSISHFHRLTSDEGWHFYEGDPLRLLQLNPKGELSEIKMGPNSWQDEKFQHIVPAGDWFASTSYGDYSLVGCTVSPGFEFQDFEMADKKELKKEFPQHEDILEQFCL